MDTQRVAVKLAPNPKDKAISISFFLVDSQHLLFKQVSLHSASARKPDHLAREKVIYYMGYQGNLFLDLCSAGRCTSQQSPIPDPSVGRGQGKRNLL